MRNLAFRDLRFSRLGAMRAGPAFGPELVTNGAFTTDLSGWSSTAPASATWSAGRAVLARNSGSSVQSLFQILSLTIGASYQVSVDVIAVSHNVALFSTGGGVPIGSAITAPGTYTFTYLWPSGGAGIYVGCGGATTATATVDNISIRAIL